MRILTTAAIVFTLAAATSMPVAVQAGPRHFIKDRVEDRLDRRENRRDEAVDHGWRDRLEDRIDRLEDRCDRNNACTTPLLNKWERYSWWRLWGNG